MTPWAHFGYEFIGHPDRLIKSLSRKNGSFVEVEWDEALDLVANRFRKIRDRDGGAALGVFTSAKCTNEENYLLQKFARAVLVTHSVEHCARLVTEYEEMSLGERRAFWRQQFLKCLKCYGCRNICPECFCESCALEDPLWVERGVLAPPFPMFHLIRAMHMAGRCVACRQCELTCPAHIPLTVLYDLIRRDVGDLLGYVPGADVAAPPPLSLTLEEAPVRMKLE